MLPITLRRIQDAYSDVIRSAFRQHSIGIPLIRSAIPGIRSESAERLKRKAGMVAAHEAIVHAQDSRGSSSSLRVRLPAPPDRAGVRDVAIHGLRLPEPRRARWTQLGAG